jgi:hypothetical protein
MILTYNKISDLIQILYEKFILELDTHPFFRNFDISMRREKDRNFEENNFNIIKESENIKYNKNGLIPENLQQTQFIYKRNIIPENLLNEYFLELQKTNNYEKIQKNLMNMSKYYLPTTVDNLDYLLNKFNNSNKEQYLNICIIGGGPIGMFLGLYLEEIFNKPSSLNNIPRMNILVLDNRKVKDNIREPFTRYRSFAFGSKLFSLIIPKIYCWKDDDAHFMNINILENILYLYIYHRKINYYVDNDKKDLRDYYEILEKGNFDAVIDCSGGRLKNDIFRIKNTTWLDKIKYDIKREDLKLEIDKKNNLVRLEQLNRDFPDIYYFCEMQIWQMNSQNMKDINFLEKFDIVIKNNEDLKYLEKLNKLDFIHYNEIKNIISSIKDKHLRYALILLTTNIKKFLSDLTYYYIDNINSDKLIFKFTVFNTNIRHAIEISKVFKVKNKQILYIGAGDTIFHSHWYTGSGLNRTIDFSTKCVHLMSLLYFANQK